MIFHVAFRQLGANSAQTAKNLEKLSSGLRINRAGDDAAGLAISEKMRGQIRGLEMASKNAQDSISLIQTAEGALNETHSILQRMRELAVQSSNDSNTDTDRKELQKEVDQLSKEISRISNTTEFNTKNLSGGFFSGTFHVGANQDQNLSVSIGAMDAFSLGIAEHVQATSAKLDPANTIGIVGADLGTSYLNEGAYTLTSTANGTAFDFKLTDADGKVVATGTAADAATTAISLTDTDGNTISLVGDGSLVAGSTALSIGHDGADVSTATANIKSAQLTQGTLAEGNYTIKLEDTDATTGGAFTASLVDANGQVLATANLGTTIGAAGTPTAHEFSFTDADGNAVKLGFTADELANGQSETATITITKDGYTSGKSSSAVEDATKDGELYENAVAQKGIDIRTQATANTAITKINTALEKVSEQRSALGAVQNRLEHTINNLGTSSENLTAAESRIRDVDMAKEMMEFTKNNILSQAAQAMLAQANQQPQGVLQLLR
jgi:flagellin